MIFDPNTLYWHMPIIVFAHGVRTPVAIRELYVKGKTKQIVGFNAGGSSFDLDGHCKITPWVVAEPYDAI